MKAINIENQKRIYRNSKKLNEDKNVKYSILTMGCQLNENDSEKLSGMIEEMGYTRTENIEEADLIVFNTCCVRENAEDKLFGKLGEVKKIKKRKKRNYNSNRWMYDARRTHCGKITEKLSFFDIVFGTHTLHKFPQDLYNIILNKKRIKDIINIDGEIVEGLPIKEMIK